MQPQFDENTGWVTAILAVFSGAWLLVWKSWLRVRADLREDGKGAKIHGTYEELVDELRAEIARVRGDWSAQRAIWEQREGELLARIDELERRCGELEGPGKWRR